MKKELAEAREEEVEYMVKMFEFYSEDAMKADPVGGADEHGMGGREEDER